MGKRPDRGRAARQLAYGVSVAMAVVVAFGTACGTGAKAETTVADFRCHGAILDFGPAGARMLEHFDDGHGHDVALWCVRGVFQAHFDLRIGWNDGGVRRFASIAGCFFDDGRNDGPSLSRDPDGSFSAVAWTNMSRPSDHVAYRFTYDVHTALVTVAVETPCHPPIVKVIRPQPDIERLEALLPDPPSGSCR